MSRSGYLFAASKQKKCIKKIFNEKKNVLKSLLNTVCTLSKFKKFKKIKKEKKKKRFSTLLICL